MFAIHARTLILSCFNKYTFKEEEIQNQSLLFIQSVSRIWKCKTRLWWFGFRFEPIFDTAKVPQNMTLTLKVAKTTQK